MGNLLFAAYYLGVTVFWLVKIMAALGAKAIMRSFGRPERARAYFAVVYIWGIIYSTLVLAGYITLTDNVLQYDNPWLLLAVALAWALYTLNNFAGLVRLPFTNLEDQIRKELASQSQPDV